MIVDWYAIGCGFESQPVGFSLFHLRFVQQNNSTQSLGGRDCLRQKHHLVFTFHYSVYYDYREYILSYEEYPLLFFLGHDDDDRGSPRKSSMSPDKTRSFSPPSFSSMHARHSSYSSNNSPNHHHSPGTSRWSLSRSPSLG